MNFKRHSVFTLTLLIAGLFPVCSQNTSTPPPQTLASTHTMKIEIWSDVMCPFCYIGKRKFEKALAQFEHQSNVEVVWKSYLLDPHLVSDSTKSIHAHLAQSKGWTLDYAKEMGDYVSNMAKEEGLNYDFDKVKVANTFDAHRLIQFAKQQQKGDLAEEHLFRAYFIEGKNLADHVTLIQIGTEIGLMANEVKAMLNSDLYSIEVKHDLNEADSIGVSGVPFFVIDRKFAISGAQASATFLNAMQKAWKND